MSRSTTAALAATLAFSRLTPAAAEVGAAASASESSESSEEATPGDLTLRLSLSSFLYRETGNDAPALVDQGAELQNASPVRRYFGDLRLQLGVQGLSADARIRQTGARRYQAGGAGGGEYEVRTLDYRLGNARTSLTIGRQFIDAVGATKVDGVALTRRLTKAVEATLFGGAFPALGSRSLDTDYGRIRNQDGSDGARMIPLTGGVGLAYQTNNYHGDLGVAAVYVAQTVPEATSEEASRVFTTSSGYWRPRSNLDIYHFALLDVAGAGHGTLTNGSLGIDLRPVPTLKVSGTVHHVSADLLQIAARNLLADPDPTMIGIVQNNIAVVRVSQDVARGVASVALAQQRFELSVAGSLHRRPALAVGLADGTGTVTFPETKAAETSLTVLDRRSLGGLRVQASASLSFPLGSGAPNRSRSTVVRLAASRMFAEDRGQLEVDAMGAHLRDTGANEGCMTSLDVLACYGMSSTTAAQLGAVASWRASREWLLLADTHLGYQDISTSAIDAPVAWPKVYSITSFVRLQWQYR